MRNKEVAHVLREIADYLEMQDVEWKPRAYRRAARSIENLSEDVAEVWERGELEDIDGVGQAISGKVAEYLETGTLEYLEDLKEEAPVDIEALTAVQGLGPKRVKQLYQALDVTTLEELEAAAKEGRIAEVEGFGETSQQNILDHIGLAKRGRERMLLGDAYPLANAVEEELEGTDAFDCLQVVGSFRRRSPTIGDIDILATASDPEEAMDAFCSVDDVKDVLARGDTKASILVAGDLQIDLRLMETGQWGAAIQYFTGNKDHNVTLRGRAREEGWKLNEYGLFDEETDEKLAGETEDAVYAELGCATPPPELREDTGEIDAAAADALPGLVEQDAIKGDLQMHTTWSDGSASIQEMAEAAAEKGYAYILITDHGPTIGVTGGMDADELREQAEEVEQVDTEADIRVLHGVETDIDADGLDLPDAALEELDLVVAALHNPTADPTGAVVDALSTGLVDILAHPTNRKLLRRDGYDLDMDRVVEAAEAHSVAVEINAQPARLDLDWRRVKAYRGQVPFVVSTDAHSTSELDLMRYGVWQARKGWLEPDHILNTRAVETLLDAF